MPLPPSAEELGLRLRHGLTLQTGPFHFRIQSAEPAVARGLATMYTGFPLGPDEGLRDFHVSVDRVRGPRRWLRPQIEFLHDGQAPFKPLPAGQA